MDPNYRFLFIEAKSHMLRSFQQFFQLPQIVELKGGIVFHYVFSRGEKNRFRASIEFEASPESYKKLCDFMTKQGFRYTSADAVNDRRYPRSVLWYDTKAPPMLEIVPAAKPRPEEASPPAPPIPLEFPSREATLFDSESLIELNSNLNLNSFDDESAVDSAELRTQPE